MPTFIGDCRWEGFDEEEIPQPDPSWVNHNGKQVDSFPSGRLQLTIDEAYQAVIEGMWRGVQKTLDTALIIKLPRKK